MDDLVISGSLRNKIISGILDEGIITESMLEEAISLSKSKFKPLEDVLIDEGFVSKERLENFIEKFLELPRVDLTSYVPDPEALKFVPKNLVHKHLILPLFEIEGVLTVAVGNPLTLFKLDEISNDLNIELDPVLASESSIIDAIIVYYGVSPEDIETKKIVKESEEVDYSDAELFRVDLDRLAIIEGDAVNQLLGEILVKAKKAGANAVHIEPIKGDFRLMFRIDGELRIIGEAARSLQKPLVEQIKYLARISKNADLPQERISDFPRAGEVLVSIYPSVYGERVVISFLSEYVESDKLSDFGFSDEEVERIEQDIKSKSGLIIIGAPVRSGKTSLLRAFLKKRSLENKSAFLLGPEEIKPLEGVQFQKLRGEELISAIEGIAYQDIDIVGIDELDSSESFKAAIRLSEKTLTIITMEASNVTDALARLLRSGVEPFSLSWNLRLVISLRMLRKNCQSCLEEYKPPLLSHKAVKKFLGEETVFRRSTGCEVCSEEGYNGYVVLPEVLFVKDSVAQRIAVNFNEESFYNFIRTKACPTPLKKGFDYVAQGLVTLEELYRKTGFRE
ncbi:MAG: ATPase, T2SS/T4P/T4SS family [Actinobacteria bacterium]|nr:ATPase, T2SS/T4P/T4SS family [Actinomycetota bacterium]